MLNLVIWFSGGLVSVRSQVGLNDLEVSSNLDNSVILWEEELGQQKLMIS